MISFNNLPLLLSALLLFTGGDSRVYANEYAIENEILTNDKFIQYCPIESDSTHNPSEVVLFIIREAFSHTRFKIPTFDEELFAHYTTASWSANCTDSRENDNDFFCRITGDQVFFCYQTPVVKKAGKVSFTHLNGFGVREVNFNLTLAKFNNRKVVKVDHVISSALFMGIVIRANLGLPAAEFLTIMFQQFRGNIRKRSCYLE